MWLGIKGDPYSSDSILYVDILQGLIISPLLIVAYFVIICGVRGHYKKLLQKYEHDEFTAEERDQV